VRASVDLAAFITEWTEQTVWIG